MENIVTNRAKSRERLSRNIQIIKETYHLTTNDIARHVGHEKHTMALRLKCPHLLTWEDLGRSARGVLAVREAHR